MHISARTKHHVVLREEEKVTIQQIIKKGASKARTITRARVLQLTDAGRKDSEICTALGLDRSVIYDTRKNYVKGGLHRAIYDLPHTGAKRKLTGEQEAQVVAIACTEAPVGADHWTLDLLVEEVKAKLDIRIGRTAIWKVLLRNKTKPWSKKNVVYTEYNAGISHQDA